MPHYPYPIYLNGMRRGFSILEMLVVMGILAILSSTLILYNRAGERQLVILREKARLIGTIVQAKSYATNMFVDDAPACGYGVHIDASAGKYFIYRDRAINCRTSDRIWGEASDEAVSGSLVALQEGVDFGDGAVSDIMFVPPHPEIYLDGGNGFREAVIGLSSADGSAKGEIIITDAGQISG